MVVIVHLDHDAIKPRDGRHVSTLVMRGVGPRIHVFSIKRRPKT
jgi:hypothetical protein